MKSNETKKRKSNYNPNRICYLTADGKYYCYERWDDDAKCVVTQRLEVGNIREFYSQLFGQALLEYNTRKAHPYQRIPDYYEHIRKGKQEKPYEEIVVQFGDMQDCGFNSENWETAKTMLDEYMQEFIKSMV